MRRRRRTPAARGGRGGGRGGAPGAAGRGGPPAGGPPAGAPAGGGAGGGVGQSGCHDITAYPGSGYAGGACAGYGLLFDVRDPKNPKRLKSVADSNMSFWHSATFSNDGSKLLFSDEWGGGGAARCRATDKLEWGGNAIFTVEKGELKFQSYYKMPAPQTTEEICTAHNGSLIPVPGRDIMVQAFYMGGATVFDWTDPAHPIEIGFFDRGPGGGYWSTYWYNGAIMSSDEQRGLDVHELTPSGYLSQNEIDAAKTVRYEQFNAQEQPHTVWPPSFALARAYLDQLERNSGLRVESHQRDSQRADGGRAWRLRRPEHRARGAGAAGAGRRRGRGGQGPRGAGRRRAIAALSKSACVPPADFVAGARQGCQAGHGTRDP